MQHNMLKGRVIEPRQRLKFEGGEYFVTGGTLPLLTTDVLHTDQFKATVAAKRYPGGPTFSLDVILPRSEFLKGNPHNQIGRILKLYDKLPAEAICVNIPFKMNEKDTYAECTSGMLNAYIESGSFYAIPVVSVQIYSGNKRLARKGDMIIPMKSSELQFNVVNKGRYAYSDPISIPKGPAFMEKGYESYNAGLISMMNQLLDGPIKDGSNILFNDLSPSNFLATLYALETYWSKTATLSKRGSFSVNTKFIGNPLNPIMEDERLAYIRSSVRSYQKVTVETIKVEVKEVVMPVIGGTIVMPII
jgi:hypothetical protein